MKPGNFPQTPQTTKRTFVPKSKTEPAHVPPIWLCAWICEP